MNITDELEIQTQIQAQISQIQSRLKTKAHILPVADRMALRQKLIQLRQQLKEAQVRSVHRILNQEQEVYPFYEYFGHGGVNL